MVNSVQALSVDSVVTDIKKTTVETVKTIDTSSTFKQIYSDVKSGITGLASALKVGAEHVYIVLVKQQVANAITYLIIVLFFLITPLFYFKRCYKWADENSNSSDGFSWVGFVLITIFPLIIGVVLFCVNVDDIIMGFINPEYGAIQEIIHFVK